MKIVVLTGSYNLQGTSNTLVREFRSLAVKQNQKVMLSLLYKGFYYVPG